MAVGVMSLRNCDSVDPVGGTKIHRKTTGSKIPIENWARRDGNATALPNFVESKVE